MSVTVFLLAVAASAAMPATSADDDAGHWSWYAPADASGPGAFRVTVDFGADNDCEVHGEAAGVSSSGPNAWITIEGSGWAMTSSGEIAHAHSDELDLDTRGEAGGLFGLGATFGGSFGGIRAVSVLVTEMDGWLASGEDPVFPAGFDISCDAPISILGFAGSNEVVGFNEQGMSGGTGAHVNGLFVGAAVNVGDAEAATFASDAVEVDIIDWVWSGPDLYEWTLEMPHESHTATGVIEPNDAPHFEGPAGEYRFELDRVAAGQVVRLSVWMAGFEPVGDLDELV